MRFIPAYSNSRFTFCGNPQIPFSLLHKLELYRTLIFSSLQPRTVSLSHYDILVSHTPASSTIIPYLSIALFRLHLMYDLFADRQEPDTIYHLLRLCQLQDNIIGFLSAQTRLPILRFLCGVHPISGRPPPHFLKPVTYI